MIDHRWLSYQDGSQALEGYLSYPVGSRSRLSILIAPTWLNVNESICRRADDLAAAGYTVFVLDLFGVDVRPGPPQDPRSIVEPFLTDRLKLRQRLRSGLDIFIQQPECLANALVGIGYCLGGCGVLEFARSGVPLRGVISLHGDLSAPFPASPGENLPKVLVLHGNNDVVASFDQVLAFRAEMTRAGVDWEIDLYSQAGHGFTGEGSVGTELPEAIAHPQAEKRSWLRTLSFLDEIERGVKNGR